MIRRKSPSHPSSSTATSPNNMVTVSSRMEELLLSTEGRTNNEETPSKERIISPSRLFNVRSGRYYENGSNNKIFLLLLLSTHLTLGFLVWLMSSGTFFHNASSIKSCPKDMEQFANSFSNNLDPKRKASFENLRIESETKKFTAVPSEFRKTFYYDGKKISQPVARAFRSRGWLRVDDIDDAHLIYTYSNNADWAANLKPWQRFNHINDMYKWNSKSDFVYYYKKYQQVTKKSPSMYVPESYMLNNDKREIETFRNVLEEEDGKKYPWVHKLSNVNQGRGITIMAPNSPELLSLPDKSLRAIKRHWNRAEDSEAESSEEDDDEKKNSEEDDEEESIIQRYICNEMTWDRRKFDVRMYWFVASLDPLIVLYHDGYVRIGNGVYNEKDFSDTTAHLTSHTGLGAEWKANFAQFEQTLNEKRERHKDQKLRQGLRLEEFPNGNTPVEHVRNQFKHSLGEMIEIMKEESFVKPDGEDLTSENSFMFYCADFILDNDMDVWFIEPQNGCGLDEDYYFRLEMHASLFNGMVDILEEVGHKQELGIPLLPLENSGNWEVIYADGKVYYYDGYERSNQKDSCDV
mmetsp:Transcript_8243/g.9134  ORF Transcript_8243/g.9134 Transcript_8243/m.9134 type:complete len:577 (+) Transcript_8243:99-1829(+)